MCLLDFLIVNECDLLANGQLHKLLINLRLQLLEGLFVDLLADQREDKLEAVVTGARFESCEAVLTLFGSVRISRRVIHQGCDLGSGDRARLDTLDDYVLIFDVDHACCFFCCFCLLSPLSLTNLRSLWVFISLGLDERRGLTLAGKEGLEWKCVVIKDGNVAGRLTV